MEERAKKEKGEGMCVCVCTSPWARSRRRDSASFPGRAPEALLRGFLKSADTQQHSGVSMTMSALPRHSIPERHIS